MPNQARLHKTVQYDECGTCTWIPANPKPHLPTREVTGASIPGVGTDADQSTVEYRLNWSLRAQTGIVDPKGLNIRSKTVYDEPTGLPIETRQPSDLEGKGAGTEQDGLLQKRTESGPRRNSEMRKQSSLWVSLARPNLSRSPAPPACHSSP